MTRGLLREGWRVFAGTYMQWHELPTLAKDHPEALTVVPLDVGVDGSVAEAAEMLSQRASTLDLLISNAAIHRSLGVRDIRGEVNFGDMQAEFNVNALGTLRLVRALYPQLIASDLRRICIVSSEAGCLTRAYRKGEFGYCMSKVALNMAATILANDLGPQGFDLRLYHPGWVRSYMSGEKNLAADMEPDEAAAHALAYFLAEPSGEKLVMRDFRGEAWPW